MAFLSPSSNLRINGVLSLMAVRAVKGVNSWWFHDDRSLRQNWGSEVYEISIFRRNV